MSKLSEQQEKFCRNIVEGMNQGDAYREAGYKCASDEAAWANASRLISNDKVAIKIAELRGNASERAEVTLQWLIEQAQDVLEAAMTDSSHAAAISAIKELGVLTGERVEKRQNENTNRDASEYSRAELLAIAKGSSQGASAARSSARKLN
jgi:phage terminase small subunit